MGPGGPGTFVLLLSACVLVVVVLAAWWNRLGGRGVRQVMARVTSLLLVQVLVLSTAGVLANRQFGFFDGWSDVLTAVDPSYDPGASAVPASPTTGRVDTDTNPVQVPGGEGRIWRVSLTGAVSGTTSSALVVLPKGYLQAPSSAAPATGATNTTGVTGTTGYPVIMALHGWPGTSQQWLSAMDLMGATDRAANEGRIAPSVLVMPDLEVPAGRDTECVDGAAGQPQLETWLSRDLPDYLGRHYRLAAGSSSWATVGLSMGGWCANMLTMLHPDRFGAAVSFGGYYQLDLGAWKPWPVTSTQARRYDLVALAQARPPAVRLWATTSSSDQLSNPSTTAMARSVGRAASSVTSTQPISMTVVQQPATGHRVDVWARQLPQALTWLGKSGQGFCPLGTTP